MQEFTDEEINQMALVMAKEALWQVLSEDEEWEDFLAKALKDAREHLLAHAKFVNRDGEAVWQLGAL